MAARCEIIRGSFRVAAILGGSTAILMTFAPFFV